MGYIILIHTLLRWLIVAVGVAAVIWLALGLIRKTAYGRPARILAAAFSGLMDLQGVLGLIYLIWNGLASSGFPLERLVHTAVMIIAIVIGHLPARWKNADDSIPYRVGLLAVAGALILTFIGVALLSLLRGMTIG